jgi:hypothetical protein
MQSKSSKIITSLTILFTAVVVIGLSGCKTSEATKPGRIIVTNETIPASSAVYFHFALSYGAQVGHPDGLALRGGDQIDSGFTLAPGNYAVSETVPQGWELTNVVINDASGGSFSSGNLATIALAAGETVTIKFTNTPTDFPTGTPAVRLGSIVLIVQTSPDGAPASFKFTLSYGAQLGYPNGIQLSSGQLIDSRFTLPPGNYVINEEIPTGWQLSDIVINDASGGSSSSGSMATIALAEGETVTVTYTNRVLKTGRIILMVQTNPDGAPDDFGFTLSYGAKLGYPDGLRLRDGQLIDSAFTLPANQSYTINEIVPPGWQVTKIDINVGNSGKPYISSLTTSPPPYGTVATIGLGEGETVVVTFYNSRTGTAPTPAPTAPTPTRTTVSLGRIIVQKQTNPADVTASFSFAPSYGSQSGYPNGFLLRNGQQIDSGYTIAPGTYTIVETPPAGWQVTVYISDPGGGSYSSGNTAIVNLAAGETVAVTFVNNRTYGTQTPVPTTTPPPVAGPRYGGTLVLTRNTDISSWDPVENLGDDVLDLIYQRLWQGDWAKGPAGGFGTNSTSWLYDNGDWSLKTGAIAESCSWTVDQASGQGIILYKIRRGIRWQMIASRSASQLVNGRELTADDVIFCLRRAITENTAYIKLHYPELSAANISKTGDWEITISIPSANLDSAINIFSGSVYVYPPEIITSYGNMRQTAVGSGPFSLSQVVPGTTTWLSKNPNFWMTDPVGPGKGNQLPYLDGVKVLVIADRSTRLAALRTGKIDYLRGVSVDDAVPLMQQNPVLRQILGVSSYSFWWPWVKNYSGEDTIGYNERIWPQYVWYDVSLKTNMGY